MTVPKTPITIARGDGIGPEIMEATLAILAEAGAAIELEEIEIGESIFKQGISSGIEDSSWESLRRTKVFLKAPITTPQGKGFKSLNVTIRKTLGLYANIRPCVSYAPFVPTKFPNMDVVIVRENEEDLYTGIEYRQTNDVYQCLKVISRPGCERIIRYAFEYARANHRQKVSAFVKDNIMKLTDGIFHQVFDEIAKEYPEIQSDHYIVDIGAARLADTPEIFDVIVTLNLYGDIISDIAAQIAGSVGLAGSSNIGTDFAMFEAIHGSAPMIAGQNIANPSGLLMGAVLMLVHIGQPHVAEIIHNAWLRAIEDGCHTADIFDRSISRERCSTQSFARAVIARLGQKPEKLPSVSYDPKPAQKLVQNAKARPLQEKCLIGVDVYIDSREKDIEKLASIVKQCTIPGVDLTMIANPGLKIWPNPQSGASSCDFLRCRFMAITKNAMSNQDVVQILDHFHKADIDFVKIENLYTFSGLASFSQGQGE